MESPTKETTMKYVATCGIVLVLLLTAGCGPNGDANLMAYDLSGWWEAKGKAPGSTDPLELYALLQSVQIDQTVWLDGYELQMQGATLKGAYPNPGAPNRAEIALGIVNSDDLRGSQTMFVNGKPDVSVDIVLQRTTAPSGSLTAQGQVGLLPVFTACSTAFGFLDVDAGLSLTYLELCDRQPYTRLIIDLAVPGVSPHTPGTLNVGSGPSDLHVFVETESAADMATAGFVKLTQLDAKHASGNGEITMGGGQTLTFDFSVDLIQKP